MGGSKKQTVGYWYKLLLHFGWCQGPIDAFLEFRGGDRTAWKGELTHSGQIQINARELWGGEEREGGIEGAFDVMLGEADQQPSSYLAANLGPQQSAYRGRAGGVFRGGRYGAFNPYPKPASFKLRRILKGWDDDQPWYPETAVIRGRVSHLLEPTSLYIALDTSGSMGGERLAVLKQAMSMVFDALAAHVASSSVPLDIKVVEWSTNATSITRAGVRPDDFPALRAFVEGLVAGGGTNATAAYGGLQGYLDPNTPRNNVVVCVSDGAMSQVPEALVLVGDMLDPNTEPYSAASGTAVKMYGVGITTAGSLESFDNSGEPVPVINGDSAAELADLIMGALYTSGSAKFMNPAHILYDSLTSQRMQAEPVAHVDDASFRAAASRLWAEGFGLCTTFDPASETVEDFQQRICNVIGGSLGRSHASGLWYLELIRGDVEPSALPVITDDDILEWSAEPSTLDDAVSQVVVAWRDPEEKEDRVTAPVQSLGAIRNFGVISETASYREIPYEELALRVGARDLQAKSTPLHRFPGLVCKRSVSGIRAGQLFLLQAPRRGIASMVCLAGSVDYGTTRSSAVRIEAVQSVFGMPALAYVAPETGVDTGGVSDVPLPVPAQRGFEVPYVALAGSLSAADLAALAPEEGFAALVAAAPEAGLGYTLLTSAAGAPWEEVGQGEWCATATLVEAAAADPGQTLFTLTAGDRLQQVAIGSGALWGEELVRVDALGPDGAVQLARGCGDTLPMPHAAGERIWFLGLGVTVDPTERVAGEVVSLKALTRAPAARLVEAAAPAAQVTIGARAARPYPPAGLQVNGELAPAAVTGEFTLTWAHRDRIGQADQLVDATFPSVGPEPTVRYGIQVKDGAGAVLVERADVDGSTAKVDLAYAGPVQLRVYSISDNGTSVYAHVWEFDYTPGLGLQNIITAPAYEPPYVVIDGGEIT